MISVENFTKHKEKGMTKKNYSVQSLVKNVEEEEFIPHFMRSVIH